MEENAKTLLIAAALYLVFLLFILALSAACYILRGLALHALGKRRGMRACWLAWVPLANLWLLCALGDQCRFRSSGKRSNMRWWVSGLLLLSLSLAVLSYFFGNMTELISSYGEIVRPATDNTTLSRILVCSTLAAAAAVNVLFYICLYRVYRSCRPQNAVCYLLLSIFIEITMPFFLYSCSRAAAASAAPPDTPALADIPVSEEARLREVWTMQEQAQTIARGLTPEQLEAFLRILEEYPTFTREAIQTAKDGEDLVEFLSVLDSFY